MIRRCRSILCLIPPLFASYPVAAEGSHPVAAEGLRILVTNDDGLTSNVKALYEALKADGHDVIVSVPCQGQSGMGAALKIGQPLGPLATACLNGAATIGDPGAGPMTREGFDTDWYYVDGTPVMATLYGLDVQAPARWGKMPDLVVSGPNEGQNVGAIVISSGTVSNVQYAAIRGLPAIAFSADEDTADNKTLANPKSLQVARLSADFVKRLRTRNGTEPMVPFGTALNVNYPRDLEKPRWRFSRLGTYNAYRVKFVTDLGADPAMAVRGLGNVHLPGISLSGNDQAVLKYQQDDESVVYKTDIAVSIMQIGYDADKLTQRALARRLKLISAE